MLELILFVAVIFGAGFGSGFAVPASVSRRRRKRAREQASDAFPLPTGLIPAAPLMSSASQRSPSRWIRANPVAGPSSRQICKRIDALLHPGLQPHEQVL